MNIENAFTRYGIEKMKPHVCFPFISRIILSTCLSSTSNVLKNLVFGYLFLHNACRRAWFFLWLRKKVIWKMRVELQCSNLFSSNLSLASWNTDPTTC